jgi:ABC-type multidrug transport system ATPase subunit
VTAAATEAPPESDGSLRGDSSPPPAVLVEDLHKSYGHVEALRGLDLRLEPGVFLTIFGPNGAGKTTLMKVLSTLTRPTEGSALVGGKDVVREAAAVRKRVGVISHNTFLYAQLTGLENLEFYAHMYRVQGARERALALLSKMELTQRMHDRVATYSRGMQQRLSVARALLHDPELLLLDEPYTGLDQHASRVLAEVLEGLRDGTRAVIMTTHNLQEGLSGCDRAAIMVDGRIVFDQEIAAIDVPGFQHTYFACVHDETPSDDRWEWEENA